MLKARISTHKGAAESFFAPYHVTLFTSDVSEITQKHIQTLIAKASQNFNNVLVSPIRSSFSLLELKICFFPLYL
jgi:hypothetical protein